MWEHGRPYTSAVCGVFRSREAGPLHELHVLVVVVVVVVVVRTLLKKSLRLRHFATELHETS